VGNPEYILLLNYFILTHFNKKIYYTFIKLLLVKIIVMKVYIVNFANH